MKDKSLVPDGIPQAISDSLQRFIDLMVEEIVLKGKPFDYQRKYLKKYSENEGLDYGSLEANIEGFLKDLNSSLIPSSDLEQVESIKEKGRVCYLSEETIKKVVDYTARSKHRDKMLSTWHMVLTVLGAVAFLALVLFLVFRKTPVVETESVAVVQQDTIIKRQYATEAERLYREAADKGDADAQFRLGFDYLIGAEGLSKDHSKAVEWMTKAADQGEVRAQYQLGLFYENGNGVPQDYKNAVKWYKEAADQGEVRAQYQLGLFYENGNGVPQDYKKAAKWYKKASVQGHRSAQYHLGLFYEKGNGVPHNFITAEEWFKKAADGGNTEAQYHLGNCYSRGESGFPRDSSEAIKWYEKAADQGHRASQFQLGQIYERGKGVPQDIIKAKEWYRKAADQDLISAKERLEELNRMYPNERLEDSNNESERMRSRGNAPRVRDHAPAPAPAPVPDRNI